MNRNTHNLFTFYVNPDIPDKLDKLRELSNNLWSTWDKEAIRLFNRIDPIIYRKCAHNPVMLLHSISDKRLQELSRDKGFLAELDLVYHSFQKYMSWEGHYFTNKKKSDADKDTLLNDSIAYFSMEYGLHESIPIYSGGLGVLAGDYIKAASDQAIPLAGFGLLYKYGYFTQFININGEQQEEWKENLWHLMPVQILTDENGDNRLINIKLNSETIWIKVWTISVGQIKLYLLDTDIAQNSDFIRSITDKLYDSDKTVRLLQEIVLSFGGIQLMDTLNINPSVYHLNEGHSAFIIIERLYRLIIEKKYSFEEASKIIANSTVFTTHTPVAAGNENFTVELIKKYLSDKIKAIGIDINNFIKQGTIPGDDINFWLPALALNYSRFINGVSKMHSETSRNLWQNIYPNLATGEIPIDYITNGVHTATWLSRELTILFDRYLGADYLHMAEESSIWQNVAQIPDIEIWEAHQRRKEQMISFIRQRIEQTLFEDNPSRLPVTTDTSEKDSLKVIAGQKRGAFPLSKKLQNTLSPEILTIGFARRFAPYKRANLILQDPVRLLSIITNPNKPVQFVFAGKAHPADDMGKKLIKNIIDFARLNDIEDRVVFIEDYDINVAKHIVQGVDVWLNTPIRPYEASGTSGMKAGLNGVLNFSILDGWWPECYDGDNGWAITTIDSTDSQEISNSIEANQIYDLIEGEICDLYYRRNESNLPVGWLQKMKHSIYTVGKGFNLHRMLHQYIDKFYIPASKSHHNLIAEDHKLLSELLDTEKQILEFWDEVYIKDFHLRLKKKKKEVTLQKDNTEIPITTATSVTSGDTISADCYVYLNQSPADLFQVELFCKELNTNKISIIKLDFQQKYEDSIAHYRGELTVNSSGLQGVNVRIRANIPPYLQSYHHLIKWKPTT